MKAITKAVSKNRKKGKGFIQKGNKGDGGSS